MPWFDELFTLKDFDPADRAGHWQEVLSATHLPLRVDVPPQPSPYSGCLGRRWFDDVALIELECDPCRGERGPWAARKGGNDPEYVGIYFGISGSEKFGLDDERFIVKPGDFVAWDGTQAVRFDLLSRFRKRGLILPRAALEDAGGRSWVTSDVVLDATAPSVRLLRSYLTTLAQTPRELPRASVIAARNAAVELVAGTVRPQVAPSTALMGGVLRAAVERWIARHLNDGELSPAAAAAAHGVSVRSLHRTFAAEGTSFGAVVRASRLARARQDLAAGADSVQTIAHRWGFSDASHFCRVFKNTYGLTPTDYRTSMDPDSPERLVALADR
ncbi:helix-turn-helix domain-containing protein [Nocardia amamiensis]|uniref:helix-turn-helix domain-containing protein n=1 Tax=Nocardia TaxID=1817 RepID=UPI003410AC50